MGDATIEEVFRRESGRAVATLVRLFGDVDLAEEAVQDAFLVAAQSWASTGPPPNPGGWIVTTARNRAIDRFRRESSRYDRYVAAAALQPPIEETEVEPMDDDRLRLIFLCCHPSLAPNVQVALTLRLVGGLQTPDIARAFLVPEATMAQRLVRAKHKIRAANIPYRVPAEEELSARLRQVLAVVYLIYNEGHTATSGARLSRQDLTAEAIRLARLVLDLIPDEPEARGLLALLLLSESRRPARTMPDGSLVRLADQDRTLWDRDLIAEGHALVRSCLRRNRPDPYQIQAAISAVHADAATAAATDWAQIVILYDQLLARQATPVVELNRAVAVAEAGDVAAALSAIDGLDLAVYHLYHATRADLLARVGREDEAREAYAAAIGLTHNAAERAHLERRREALAAQSPPGALR